MPDNDAPQNPFPGRVALFQEAITSPARFLVLRLLLHNGPQGYDALRPAIEGHMSPTRLFSVLEELSEYGYVKDDAPLGRKRRPSSVTFWADRELFAADLAATMAYLLG